MALTVPLERIESEARKVDARKGIAAVARVLATVLVAIPYALGWALSKAWMGVTLVWAAAATGWQDAARTRSEVT